MGGVKASADIQKLLPEIPRNMGSGRNVSIEILPHILETLWIFFDFDIFSCCFDFEFVLLLLLFRVHHKKVGGIVEKDIHFVRRKKENKKAIR